MCLSVHHKLCGNGEYHSRVTKRPILAWKGMRETYTANSARSPYMDHYWSFGKLERAKMKKRTPFRSIYVGLHCYTNKSQALAITFADMACPVVIPAGSRIYVGERGDIVSDQMILYRDLNEVKKVYGGFDDSGTPWSKFIRYND